MPPQGTKKQKRLTGVRLDKTLAQFFKDYPERPVTEIVRMVAMETGRSERTVWRHCKPAEGRVQADKQREAAKADVDSDLNKVRKLADKCTIGGQPVFIAGKEFLEATVVTISGMVKAVQKKVELTEMDVIAFQMLANSYDFYARAAITLSEEGVTVDTGKTTVVHPAVGIMKHNYEQAVKIMQEYGFTLGKRCNIAPMKEKKKDVSSLISSDIWEK